MNCCPDADFDFMPNGLQVRERNIQDGSTVYLFFPYKVITAVRYFYRREDQDSQISLWILSQGTPGAGGLSYRWRFCAEGGKAKYEQLIAALPS